MAMGWIRRILGRDSRVVPERPGVVERAAPSVSPLSRFAGQCERIVVVDTETTGVYRADRVVEIGLVSLGLDGRVIDEWDCLINPRRDVGPTWLHGISSEMLVDAPEFGDVAGEIASRLHGAVLCAHNLPFDVRMLANEFERVGVVWEPRQGLDTLAVTRTRLGVACAERGVALAGGHRALGDARAVAMLLPRVADEFGQVVPARFLTSAPTGRRVRVSRSDGQSMVAAPPTYLAGLAAQVVHRVDAAAVASYLEVLDRAMADLRLDHVERGELSDFAASVGLNVDDLAVAHRGWMLDMVAAARADGVVDGVEYDQLLRAAHVLGLDRAIVDDGVRVERRRNVTIELRAGMGVCFTGDAAGGPEGFLDRSVLENAARSVGLRVEDTMTKSRCDLLVAAELGTASGKADKARAWAKPITDVASFNRAVDVVRSGQIAMVDAVVDGDVRRVAVCVRCSSSYTYVGKASAGSVCDSCVEADKSTKTDFANAGTSGADDLIAPPSPVGEANVIETLVCQQCGRSFTRTRTRGRKPSRCPEC